MAEGNVDNHMVYSQFKGICNHRLGCLNKQSLFCLSGFIGLCILGHNLRVCYINLIADLDILLTIINCYYKAGVQAIRLSAVI